MICPSDGDDFIKAFYLFKNMKIFITNKREFDESISNSNEVHKRLYNKVLQDLSIEKKIDVIPTIPYSKNADCIFEFVGKNKDVYFYSFTSTII
jgi:hypothetical protein